MDRRCRAGAQVTRATICGCLLLAAGAPGLAAQSACPGESGFFFLGFAGQIPHGPKCLGFRCDRPELTAGPFVRLADPACDPTTTACTVELGVELEFPGNEANLAEFGVFGSPLVRIDWLDGTSGDVLAGCGAQGSPLITTDTAETFFAAAVTCTSAHQVQAVFDVRALACTGSFECQTVRRVDGLTFGGPDFAQALGCPPPPLPATCAESSCGVCVPGGANTGGGGAEANESTGTPRTGPGALLRHAAGGAGRMDSPRATEWRTALGRYWSHDYAERIVPDPDETHVWLITRHGSFREFSNLTSGTYLDVAPSDEYRTLTRTVDGWELEDLEGTVQVFDNEGKWRSTTDRNANATTGTYDTSGQLTEVVFADGRRETFDYHPDGKLATITEVGVDGVTTLVWGYFWDGDDLTRIDRPDGTSVELLYEDPRHPGYLTQMVLVGTQGGRRIERAWGYDATGNVTATWRGEVVAGANGPEPPAGAIDLYELAFDDPVRPTVTTVTDPLGMPATYFLERDPASTKPRVTQFEGSCPVCGGDPNRQLFYEDPANPLRVTQEIDGEGHVSVFEYDPHGQMTRRLEAVDTPALTRETTWQYDPTYPALVTRIERPSVTGGPELRVTTFTYDASGNLLDRTEEGVEGGAAFSLTTSTTYTPTGQVETRDPPGFGLDDVTSFTYDPARGGLLPATRTDALIGTTTFGYDPFNRRSSVTDPNGVAITTTYDELDRVTTVTQEGATDPEDLVTTSVYNEFGDLLRTVLPRGNVLEYDYDEAGRLTSIEKKPDATMSGERTLFQLDAAGNRTREELQRWDGSAWVTESETAFDYPTRCFLERVIRAPGRPEETVTEFAYDCDGNLERVWDENHPRFVESLETPATAVYAYDALERLTSVTQPWGGTGGGNVVTTYGYDVQDHLTSITDGEGNDTTYSYSDRDLLTEETSPVSGTTTHTYNEHGELVATTDGRGVTTTREVDALDRVTAVDYPTAALDTTYTYDDPAVDFSKGRLTAISRHGHSVDYRYDRFGRVTRDGGLTYAYDANGNRTEIGYPGGVSATYGYDFADRQETLDVQVGADPVQPLVTDSSYLPSGPLASLALGNGASETRIFDGRYVPAAIVLEAPTPRRWDYTTDGVGNILRIDSLIGCSEADLLLANQTVTGAETFTTCAGIEAGPAFSVETGGSATFAAGTRIALGDGFAVQSGASFTAGIDPAQTPVVETREYSYQDVQYFLTGGDGPWGSLAWTYDRIGNRLTETRDGVTDTYTYITNGGGGNTAVLEQITLGVGGTRDYQFGPAGHLERVTAGANEVVFDSDDEGRLDGLSRPVVGEAVEVLYDGRSFMQSTTDPATGAVTEPTYSSEGLLHALRRQEAPTSPEQRLSYLYFAGRPVAQFELDGTGGETLRYLVTDHLGTPVVALDESGVEVWDSGFEPFGRDAEEASPDGALANAVFLRFPGQWEDGRWAGASMGAEVFYNVHRWAMPKVGIYSKADPLGLLAGLNSNNYARANPITVIDSVGLSPKPSTAEWCDELSPLFLLCNCDFDLLQSQLAETEALRADFCKGQGVSHRSRTVDPVESGEFAVAGGVAGNRAWYDPTVIGDDPCIVTCTCVHEQNHARASDNPRVKKMIISGLPQAEILDYLECIAYSDQAECLKGFLNGT